MVLNNLTGSAKGFFQASFRLRQGDPLSPYLFIPAQEVFSRMIKLAFDFGKIKPCTMGGGSNVSHYYIRMIY